MRLYLKVGRIQTVFYIYILNIIVLSHSFSLRVVIEQTEIFIGLVE